MLTVEEALEKVLAEVRPLDTVTVPILDAMGQVLAEDITASSNVPPFDNSGMDGFALRYEDTAGATRDNPRVLKVIDTVIAGSVSRKEVILGTAMRIMTGAPVPRGANAIVQFENTDDDCRRATGTATTEIAIYQEAKKGLNVRKAGQSISAGSTVLVKGTVIRPSEIGVLASLGCKEVNVIRRPVVAILSTGDELVELGDPLPEGKIYDSNIYSLASLVRRTGGIPKILGIAEDTEAAIIGKLKQTGDADMLLTTGGVSMGDYDMVKDILDRDGEMVFWKVRLKPGKPLAFGKFKNGTRKIPHLGLPGNPVSCMVNFELFARPALLKMMGKTNTAKPAVEAVIEETVVNKDGRRIYDRAIIERRNGSYYARLTGHQGSDVLTSMSLANGLVVIPENSTAIQKGEKVQVLMLDWNEAVNV